MYLFTDSFSNVLLSVLVSHCGSIGTKAKKRPVYVTNPSKGEHVSNPSSPKTLGPLAEGMNLDLDFKKTFHSTTILPLLKKITNKIK